MENNKLDQWEDGKVFCKFCGGKIDSDVIVCPLCGKQVQELKSNSPSPQIVVNNTNSNSNTTMPNGIKAKNKWVALLLCILLGVFGAHKFYEGKILLGIVYMLTGGLFLIGVIFDFINLLFKPNPYFC